MSHRSLDKELETYWVGLNPDQEKSIQELIQTFSKKKEINKEGTGLHVNDPQAPYHIQLALIDYLSKKQKKALIALFEAFGVEVADGIDIEEYNKEIDKAMTRMDAGKSKPHEEVVELSKKWQITNSILS
jgi:hypothetical protein